MVMLKKTVQSNYICGTHTTFQYQKPMLEGILLQIKSLKLDTKKCTFKPHLCFNLIKIEQN